ncbi:hypothetical protein COO91_08010 [Nostoc flagelliforme CCNUN1]|uniref:Uncharacterized protein n=1 Tax=Nostoc flagelliforme CCNUN1 TaxID=2038116 RepID=A0A2K8T2P0_9NOSO|nr:hypothetical protein COO91_08010 [Nostoc flagelliforme CCNUN1]
MSLDYVSTWNVNSIWFVMVDLRTLSRSGAGGSLSLPL